MYKGRLGLWITIIAICTLGPFLFRTVPKWIKDITTEYDVTFSTNVTEDKELTESLSGETVDDIHFVSKSENADIIIKSHSDETIDGYKKLENMLYSPIVLFINNDVTYYSGGFIELEDGDRYKINLYDLLVAVEKEKTWEEFGVNKKIIKGKIKLTIPNKQSPYYDAVVETFYLTLNNGNVPTDEEMEKLKERVDAIIKLCDKVSDINLEIHKEVENETKTKAFIGPEFLAVRDTSYYGINNSYDDAQYPVYFSETAFICADMFIKKYDSGEQKEILKSFEKQMQEEYHFVKTSGWRVKDVSFDYPSAHNYMINNP